MDVLHRFSFVDLPIRGQWVRMDQVLDDAFRNKAYPSVVRELLGEMFAAVSMFADNLKFTGAVALQSKGDGALIRSLAECREQQYLRGIAHLDPEQALPDDADLRTWLDGGQLALSLIPEQRTEAPYQGLVELQHAALGDNLEHYFTASEQLQTRIFFASDATATTGLLLQRLPDSDLAGEVTIDMADEAWNSLSILAATVTPEELASLPVEALLRRLFNEYPVRVHPARALTFKCTCSREKSDRTLRVLDHAELEEILEEDGVVEVDCDFCGTQYSYDAVDIAALKHAIAASQDRPGTRH